jgi:enoyl-CoA hydratase/carnithine racemase
LRASEWLVLAEPFGAPEARAAGLVTEVVRDAEVFACAHSVAVRIAQKPAESVRLTKELLKAGTREVVRRTLESEGAVFMQRLRSDEALRAFADFFARAKRRT